MVDNSSSDQISQILTTADVSFKILQRYVDANVNVPGYKTSLAKKAGCQKSFFSLVLKGTAVLSLDQASSLADYWRFSDDQWLYFILLIVREKSGTLGLKVRLSNILEQMRLELSDEYLPNRLVTE